MVGLTIPDGAVPQDVLLRVENSEYPYLETKPIHKSQKFVRDEDGGKIISLHLYINTELEMQLMSYGKWIKVLAPEELHQRMKERIVAMVNNYEI